MLADEESRLGITHAGFAMTSLPHKRVEEALWRREGHRTTLLVESGRHRNGELLGVPYGSIARLILLYLQTEAVRTNSQEVELGRSMKSWMGRMSLSTGGRTYQLVAEQARRISGCRLTFFTDRENGAERRHNGAFVQDAISLSGVLDNDQPTLWHDRVRLDEGFWRSLREHPVPGTRGGHQGHRHPQLGDRRVYLAGLSAPCTAQSNSRELARYPWAIRRWLPARSPDQDHLLGGLDGGTRGVPEAYVNVEKEGVVLHPSAPAVPRVDARRLGIG